VFVVFCQDTGTMVTQFVEGWDFVQTLGEGAYGEYVLLFLFGKSETLPVFKTDF